MMLTVDFDAKLGALTIKIENIGSSWMLSAKSNADLVVSQCPPEKSLWLRHGRSQSACSLNGLRWPGKLHTPSVSLTG